MNIFDMILWPFKLAVSAVLWFFHTIFTSIGMDPSSGFTWVLCIICLTLVMRAVTIPQVIHSQHSIMNRLSTSQPGKFIQVPLFIFNIPHSRKTTVPHRKFPFISHVPQTLSPVSGNEHKNRG